MGTNLKRELGAATAVLVINLVVICDFYTPYIYYIHWKRKKNIEKSETLQMNLQSRPPPKNESFTVCVHVYVLVAQSYPTLCDPMDCSPPDSSVYGILQARTLEWGAIAFSTEPPIIWEAQIIE